MFSSVENLASALQTVYKDSSSLTPVHCFQYRNDIYHRNQVDHSNFNYATSQPSFPTLRPVQSVPRLPSTSKTIFPPPEQNRSPYIPRQTINPRHKEQDTRASLNRGRGRTISHQISYDGILPFSQVHSQRRPFREGRGADHADPAFGVSEYLLCTPGSTKRRWGPTESFFY